MPTVFGVESPVVRMPFAVAAVVLVLAYAICRLAMRPATNPGASDDGWYALSAAVDEYCGQRANRTAQAGWISASLVSYAIAFWLFVQAFTADFSGPQNWLVPFALSATFLAIAGTKAGDDPPQEGKAALLHAVGEHRYADPEAREKFVDKVRRGTWVIDDLLLLVQAERDARDRKATSDEALLSPPRD